MSFVRGLPALLLLATITLAHAEPVSAGAPPSSLGRGTGGQAGRGCAGGLTLTLRSGTVVGLPPGHPAADLPRAPVIEHLPLYPDATQARVAIPPTAIPIFAYPPAYRKAASAEFIVPAGPRTVSSWYQAALRRCGYALLGHASIPLRSQGVRYTALISRTRGGLKRLTVLVRPLSAHLTLVFSLAQVLDLPARPLNSYLRGGPFIAVGIWYHSTGVSPRFDHTYRLGVYDRATINRLEAAVNIPLRIFVSVTSGGAVESVVAVRLTFVRAGGTAQHVYIDYLGRIFVDHSRALSDPSGRLFRLVYRIVQHHCPGSGCIS